MNKRQDRRSILIPTALHEDLSYLQASVRLLMRDKNIEHVPSRTSMTKMLEALIRNADAPTLVKLLK